MVLKRYLNIFLQTFTIKQVIAVPNIALEPIVFVLYLALIQILVWSSGQKYFVIVHLQNKQSVIIFTPSCHLKHV